MTTFYERDGVKAWEYSPDPGAKGACYFGVSDTQFMHYRITFFVSGGDIYPGVDAEWSDDRPGQLANFTHEIYPRCNATDTLWIDDAGLLTALARVSAAKAVDFRQGFLLQLPVAYVQPVRLAIAKARQLAKVLAAADAKGMTADVPTILSADEHVAADWWLGIHETAEKASWMARSGNTGLALDAYREFQRTTAGLLPASANVPFGWDKVEA